jgi:hypothetical protein
LGDSSGGNDYRTNIATCPAEAVYCANTYTSENGDMNGPTKQGACQLVCYDGSSNCNSCQKDTFVSPGKYQRPDGTITSSSRSLVIAPILDICQYCATGGPPTGQSDFTVVGFALVFIDGISGNDVLAHLVNIAPCPASGGGGGGGINPNESGPFALPIRLIRTS